MTLNGTERVKHLIASILESRLVTQGVAVIDVHDDLDLRTEGIVDSLGFVQLIAELETRLGTHIDLSDIDPEHVTNVGTLARHIAESHPS